MILSDKDLQLLNTMPGTDQAKKDPELKIEFDGTTVLCRVCGDKASGFHYGVHSCEGCKGFFRRSIQQKIQYRPCTKNQQCSILRVNRNRCQYCRLKKCIAVGMSRDAVRFGRVPKREKAKILAAMQSVNARCQEKALAVELEDEAKLVGTIIKAHDETCDYTKDKIVPLLQRARANPVYTQCTPQLACPLNPNPHPLQNGNQRVLEDFSERFSPAIRGVVEFAKRIPGFGLLSQDDQVTLLKAGVFEVLLVRLACMFDSRTNTMICLNGQVLKRESLQHTSNARFLMDSMFDFAERLNMLQLLDSELGLFCAMVVIAPDRPGLRNTELVKRMQGKMMEALDGMVAHNHPQSPSLFQELMKKIPDLRTLNTLHSEKLLAFKMEPHTETAHQTSGTTTAASTTNMHALYQTQVGHWGTYGLTHKSPHEPASEDSKGSWEEQDHMVPSPALRRAPRRSGSETMSWSPSSAETKDQDLYGSPRSTDAGSFVIDDGGSSTKSPMGSVSSGKGGDGESLCSGEMSHLAELHGNKRRKDALQQHHTNHHHEGGGSSGDEGSVVDSPNGKCPYKMRKLDSPTDSGIESGKELGSSGTQSRSTSICSSPRSSLEDKVKDISDCEVSEKQESIEDMPVLKRALQAPPLINTNLLMDEAYKPHKKFRALRKDSDSTPTSPEVPTSVAPHNVSLASTHSTLVKTLEQGPQMSEQQLKRTDIIHNIIMRTGHGVRTAEQTATHSYAHVPTTGSLLYGMPQVSIASPAAAAFGMVPSPNGSKSSSVVCPPGYYIPQPAISVGTTYSSAVSAASWPTFVGAAPSTVVVSATPVSAASASVQGRASYVPVPSPTGLQQALNTRAPLSPSMQQQQHSSHHQFPSPQPPQRGCSPLQPPSTSPLPRMYYNPRGAASSSPTTLVTAPRSPSLSPSSMNGHASNVSIIHHNNHHHLHHQQQQQAKQQQQQHSSSYIMKPTSPLVGQILIEHLTAAPISSNNNGSASLASNRGTDNQPLNLSKKVASPPPSLHILESALLSQPHQRVKLETV